MNAWLLRMLGITIEETGERSPQETISRMRRLLGAVVDEMTCDCDLLGHEGGCLIGMIQRELLEHDTSHV